MVDVAELAVRLVADDQASAKLQAVQRQLASNETSLKSLASTAGLSSAAVGTAMAGMAIAAVKMGQEWDDALDKVRISTGATGEALETLKADISAVAREVPVSLGEVSGAMAELSRRTQLTGEPLQELTKQVIDFSRITGSDAVQNARLVTRAFGDWSIATEDQVGFLDKLLRASQATGVGVTTLQEGLVRYGAPLRQLGFDIDESVAILGKFEKEGVNAELVLGSLRIALGEMARQGVPAREGLNDVVTAIKNAGDASEANKLAMEIFGARAGPDMAAAIREGRLEIDQLTAAIRDGGETVKQAAADTDDGAQKFAIAANKMKVAFEPVSAAMFTAASSGLESLSMLGAGIDTFLAGSGKNMLEFRRQMAAGFALGPTGEAPPEVPLKITVDEEAAAAALDEFMTSVVGLPSIRAGGEAVGEELAEAAGDGAEAAAETAMAPWLKKMIDKGKEGAFNLKEALRDAGTDETAIAGVLDFAAQIAVIDKAISQLTDRTIAAHIIAMRNDGDQAGAAALATAHLAAQTDTATVKTEAHTKAVKDSTVAVLTWADAEKQLADEATRAANAVTLAQAKGVGGFTAEATKGQAASVLQALTAGQGPALEGWAKYIAATDQAADASRQWATQQGLDATLVEKALNGDTAAMKRLTDEIKRAQDAAAKGIQLSSGIGVAGYTSNSAGSQQGESPTEKQTAWTQFENQIITGFKTAGDQIADNIKRAGTQGGAAITAGADNMYNRLQAAGMALAQLATRGGDPALGRYGVAPGTPSSISVPTNSPFANPEFVAWYNANGGGERERALNSAGGGRDLSWVEPMDRVLQRFNTRFMESFEQGTANLRTKLVDALSHAGETFAQRLTRTTGAPTAQANLDTSVQGVAQRALSAIEQGMTLRQRADLDYTVQLQGPVAALHSLGRSINENVTEEQALAEATRGLTKTTEGYTDSLSAGATARQVEGIKLAVAADAASQGLDTAGAAAARAASSTFDMSGSLILAGAAAAAAANAMGVLAANANALMAGSMRNAGVAGGVTQKGLTYTEIMGGQTPGSTTGISSLGSNPWGLPILSGSPITPGTLRGYADGGWVNEPVVGRGMRSGAGYSFGERGPEYVSPGGGGAVYITNHISANGADALSDPRLYEKMLDRGLTAALRKRELVPR